MNENIKKVCSMSDTMKKYKVIDYLLDNKYVNIAEFDKYYRENLSLASIDFFGRYSGRGINLELDEDAVVKSENARYIYNFFYIEGANIPKLQDALIKTGNIDLILDSCDFSSVDCKKYEDYIINTGMTASITQFAIKVRKANIPRLEDAIIKTQDVKEIYRFATNVEGANRVKLIKELFNLSVCYSVDFISNYITIHESEQFIKKALEGIDKSVLEKILREVESREKYYNYSERREILYKVVKELLKDPKEKLTIDEFIENIDDASTFNPDEIRELFEDEGFTKVKKL